MKMKESCERCGTVLAADGDAMICSYECTFCPRCTEEMDVICPNCGGELVWRPRRTTQAAAIAARTPDRLARLERRSADRIDGDPAR